MEGNKLEISVGNREANEPKQQSPTATYKQIPEDDMEEQALSRPKSLVKPEPRPNETDGADEKMLPDEDRKVGSNVNVAEIKFTNNDKQNGDAKLDIGDIKCGFVGMGKEELMKYANDPFWVRLRWLLFILFWICWAGMLVGAIMIIVAAPKCAPPEPKTWWEEGPLTEVDVNLSEDSMKELAGNGFKGLIVPLRGDSYVEVNDTSPIMNFLKAAQKNDINVIVELTPGESNKWFKMSEEKSEDFDDFYIWRGEAATPENPPNNWLSVYSNDEEKISAWKFSASRKQFYFAPSRVPQLNFRKQAVVDAFTKVIENFLAAGAKGIRLKKAPHLLVDPSFADEEMRSTPSEYSQSNYNFFTHTKTENVEGLGGVLEQWRDVVKNKTGNGVFMLADDLKSLEAYKVNGSLMVDLPMHSRIFRNEEITAEGMHLGFVSALRTLENHWPLWQVENKNNELFSQVAYLLKGSTILNKTVKIDPELQEVRKSPSIIFGSQDSFLVANKTVFAYVRVHSGNPGYLVALNPSDTDVVVDFPSEIKMVSDEVTVQFLSSSYNKTAGVDLRMKHDARKFPITSQSAVVLSYVPKAE